jgi:hypothetical protein
MGYFARSLVPSIMFRMKALLIDYSNEGILYVSSNPVVVNMLKSGLVDTSTRLIWPWHNCYTEITQSRISSGERLWISTRFNVATLNEDSCNTVYLERLRLVGLRSRLTETLVINVLHASRFIDISPWPGIENNIEFALQECNMDKEQFGKGIISYAGICGIRPEQAAKELRLYQSYINDTKLRLFAHLKAFGSKINQVANELERDQIVEEMHNTFMRDTMI